jgi:hypothetical protein
VTASNASRPSFFRVVLKELRGSFPGKHHRTQLKPPDSDDLSGYDDIRTGSKQGEILLSKKMKTLGYLTWIIWFGFGVKFWWFSDTTYLEFGIATILWMLTFAFTIFGIPVTRALLKIRQND